MINIEFEQEIIQYIKSKKNGIKWKELPKHYEEYLKQRYNDNLTENIKEPYLRILNGINTIPSCPICGKNVKFVNINNTTPYSDTCKDKECISKLRKMNSNKTMINKYGSISYNNMEKHKQTCLEKYGVEHYFNREKAKQTKLERYGDENYTNKEKAKRTCLEKYGVVNGGCSKEALEKIKQTCLEKYGVESSWEIPGIKEKSKQTKLKKYGNENFVNPEKTKQTCLEKYGVDNPFKVEEIKEKARKTCLKKYGVDHNWKIPEEHELTYTPEAIEKRKQTCLEKFGVEFVSQSEEIKNKKYDTMKRNNSYGKSKLEDKCYELLKEKYPDIIRQYRSKLYQFSCDFYIPSLDLYIEYQGSHYHHNHPFDENNQNDLDELNKLKELSISSLRHKKSKNSQYDIIIYTWTDLDVRKRKMAKENNLNFIEFWSIEELKKWLLN